MVTKRCPRGPLGPPPILWDSGESFNHSESPDPILTLGFQKRQLGLTDNTTDIFTKALAAPVFLQFRRQLMTQ